MFEIFVKTSERSKISFKRVGTVQIENNARFIIIHFATAWKDASKVCLKLLGLEAFRA